MPTPRQASLVTLDDLPTHTAEGYLIAQHTPASEESAQLVLRGSVGPNTRSPWKWLLLANGDLALVTYPQGTMYERITAQLKRERNPLIS